MNTSFQHALARNGAFSFLLFSLFIVFLVPAYSQKIKPPTDAEVSQAKKLRVKYNAEEDEAENVILLNSIDEYSFSLNPEKNKVRVSEKTSETIMSINSLKGETARVKFYNDQSEIESITVLSSTGKKLPITINDEYYQSNDIFYSDAKLKYFGLRFWALGMSYKINYHKNYKDIKYFTSVYFNDIISAEKKTVKFMVPRWLNIELKEMNFGESGITKTKSFDASNNADIYEYTATDLAKFSNENDAPGRSHIYPHILILAKSFNNGSMDVALFESIKDLYTWYQSLVGLMKNDNEVLKSKVNELTKDKANDLEKVKSIYYWVQDNIRYIAFEDGLAGFKPEECQEVYNKRYGDCKGMANLTKEMLKIAGFDARLTWIGTRRIAYDYSTPNLAVDNHMICTVILDGEKYFLDPTDKYCSFDDYAERLQSRQVLIEDGEKFILSNIPIRDAQDNTRQINSKFKISGDQLTGNVNRMYKGESRSYLLYQINYTETDRLDEALNRFISQGDKNLKIADLQTSDFENRDQLFTLDYSLAINNAVSSFDDEIYLEVDYYKEMEGFEFKKRKLDYQFPYKYHVIINTEIELPDGYEVSELPEKLVEDYDDFSATISYQKNGNTLFYNKEIMVNKGVIKKDKFGDWNTFINNLESKYEEQIVLKKKS